LITSALIAVWAANLAYTPESREITIFTGFTGGAVMTSCTGVTGEAISA
jgi:hypothetical protein